MAKSYSNTFDAVITAMEITEPRAKDAGEGAYEIMFYVHTDGGADKGGKTMPPQDVEISLEVSLRPSFLVAGATMYEDAGRTLVTLGYSADKVAANDFCGVFDLVGKPCRIYSTTQEKDGKTYTHWYFSTNGGVFKPKKVEDAMARMAQMKKLFEESGGANATPQFSVPADDGDAMPF